MKYIPIVAGALLGLMFVAAGLMVLLKPFPAPTGETPADLFMRALIPTGYLTFVKVLEVLGGVLVAIPRTRNLGLLVLGPIIVNILAFHIFINKGAMLADASLWFLVALALYLLWVGRKAFAGLVR